MSTVVRIKRQRLRTTILVEDWPDRTYGVLVLSSNARTRTVTFNPELWREGDREAIEQRLGDGGSEKGRVLWAASYYMVPNRWEAIGALLLHVPERRNKPVLIKRVCLQPNLNVHDKTLVTALLIRCAKRIATESGKARGRLHWEVDPQDAGQLCRQYGFQTRGTNRQVVVLETIET